MAEAVTGAVANANSAPPASHFLIFMNTSGFLVALEAFRPVPARSRGRGSGCA